MPVSAVLALCTVVIAQSPSSSDAPTREHSEQWAAPPTATPAPAADGPPTAAPRGIVLKLQESATPLPRMHWGQEVFCATFSPTPAVPSGQYRLQCNLSARECLVAPNHVVDSNGAETDEELSRTQTCGLREDWEELLRGYRFVPAIAEVQPGWLRDERGRAMQYNFDMNRRAWLGAAYAPMASQLDPGIHRLRADIGLEIEVPSEDTHTLYRWHLIDSELYLGVPSVDSTLVRLDWTSSRNRPVFFVSTFVGQPQRHDVYLDLGAWFEALHLEYLRRGGETETFLTLGAANLTWDLWHSRDLASFVRVRAGPAAEYDTLRQATWLKPEAAVEGDLTIDPDGFHHVRFSAEGEKLYLGKAVAGRVDTPERLRLQAGYEVIVVAINDQPLTLVFDAKGTYRDDFTTVAPGWEWTAEAGIRFSLWAPARRTAPLERVR